MDESIRKKRKCKRGYGEKLGENSPLRHFLPEKKNFPAFSLDKGGKTSPEGERGKARENRARREQPTIPHSVLVIELQHCETEAGNWFLLMAAVSRKKRAAMDHEARFCCLEHIAGEKLFCGEAKQSTSGKKLMNFSLSSASYCAFRARDKFCVQFQ